MDIHQTAKRLDKTVKNIEKDPLICEENKNHIIRFKDKIFSMGLGTPRALFYTYRLMMIARKLTSKRFDELTREDFDRIIGDIEKNCRKSWTKHDYKVTIKKFFQWMKGYEWYSKTYPPEVAWIRTTMKNKDKRLPEEFLTKEEIRALILTASNPRDKAFISVLYESGCRIGELMNVKIKHITFDEHGVQMIVPEGKTGPRRIRLIASIPYIESWLGYHPNKNNPEEFLWVTHANNSIGKPMGYDTIRKILRETAERAGIKKRVNPHAFRHARATHLASELTSPILCEMFGWMQGSKEPSTYIHLSGKNLDNALLKMYGKLPADEEDGKIKCPRCSEVNQEINRFCKNCGLPFGLKDFTNIQDERKKYDDIMSKLMEKMVQNPEVKRMMMETLGKIS